MQINRADSFSNKWFHQRYLNSLILILFISCFSCDLLQEEERIWDNPNDQNSDKSLWSPAEFSAEQIAPTKILLKWIDNAKSETGFRIDRKISNSDWEIGLANLSADTWVFIDNIDPRYFQQSFT